MLRNHALATLSRVASAVLLLALLADQPVSAQQGSSEASSWELKVCADQDNLPYSNRLAEGFESRLAELVATELGATLTYAWMPLPRQETDAQLMLRLGACDVVMSVADGQEPFLNTISYYSGSTFFVTRESDMIELESLDDPKLTTLQIGVNRGSPLDVALRERVPLNNLHHYLASDGPAAILRAVVNGDIDVGLVWGPAAGYFTASENLPLVLTPVTPEIDLPFLALIQPITMAVRRGDDELRDLLNRALVARWSDVQLVLDQYHVARQAEPAPSNRPDDRLSTEADPIRIGVVLPTRTGATPLVTENVEPEADAARRGAVLADEQLGNDEASPLRVLLAVAPSLEAAQRAARRMALADSATALVGGVGEGQAATLAEAAGELGIPFLNIADPTPGLRTGSCRTTTFNVSPSMDNYLSAMTKRLSIDGEHSLAVVYPATPLGRLLRERLRLILTAMPSSGWSTIDVEVAMGQPYYGAAIDTIRQSGAAAIVLLLDADEQLVFFGQYEGSGVQVPVYPYPAGGTQLRQYYWTLLADAPTTGASPRFASWDAAVPQGEFDGAFTRRYGQRAEPAAWSAYAAIQIVQQAVAAAQSASTSLLAALQDSDAQYALDGIQSTRISPSDHQLVTPVYLITLTPPLDGATFQLADLSHVLDIDSQMVRQQQTCD